MRLLPIFGSGSRIVLEIHQYLCAATRAGYRPSLVVILLEFPYEFVILRRALNRRFALLLPGHVPVIVCASYVIAWPSNASTARGNPGQTCGVRQC